MGMGGSIPGLWWVSSASFILHKSNKMKGGKHVLPRRSKEFGKRRKCIFKKSAEFCTTKLRGGELRKIQ
jgi:hypothetical protein